MSQTPPYTPVFEVASATFEDSKTVSSTSGTSLRTDTITVDTTNVSNSAATDSFYYSPTSPAPHKFDNTHDLLSNLLDTKCQVSSKLPEIPKTSSKTNSPVPYKLKTEHLESFVLSPEVFEIKLDKMIGKGSNSYVHLATLATREVNSVAMNIAIKIPTAKNKVKLLERETEFMLTLRDYRDSKWFRKFGDSSFPFVDAYGLYYLSKSQFPMMKKTDTLPCLLMKNYDTDLYKFINEKKQTTQATEPAIGLDNWYQLLDFILKGLQVLQDIGAVHCDIKTDNILVGTTLGPRPIFKFIDFTSSSKIIDIHEQPEMTLQFTPPELLKDQTKLPDYATDLYSAGLVLLQAATGLPPYSGYDYDPYYLISLVKEGKVFELLTREETNRITGNSHVHQILDAILLKRRSLEEVIGLSQ
ncbi:hypothetical protein OGAPHI_001651 [Ogataea philodendri]|uniref:Protein kinase domain-containing protein n=1 Tax=Ogataea philodendri TaxID=1378263 RepID=A0A9P8PCG2_9ASCO|nr:uncharacterized protein OGAPHI_001651 [Ogataea philodendri]KAH3669055.1 hypothetical protein OGAPHI_001651 [Ogataea philodendri]